MTRDLTCNFDLPIAQVLTLGDLQVGAIGSRRSTLYNPARPVTLVTGLPYWSKVSTTIASRSPAYDSKLAGGHYFFPVTGLQNCTQLPDPDEADVDPGGLAAAVSEPFSASNRAHSIRVEICS